MTLFAILLKSIGRTLPKKNSSAHEHCKVVQMEWIINFIVLVVFLVLVLCVAVLWLHVISKGDSPDYKREKKRRK